MLNSYTSRVLKPLDYGILRLHSTTITEKKNYSCPEIPAHNKIELECNKYGSNPKFGHNKQRIVIMERK